MNKKIINLVLRVENEAFVFLNLNARCEWAHTRLKNTNDSTIDRIFRHQTNDVYFERQCRISEKARHLQNKQRLADDAQMHIYENAFMTLLNAITTLFFVDARDTDMSKISRQTFDASNAHQIKQLDMWKNATIMHRRRRRRTYVSKDHDNRKERMIKLFIDEYLARST
jgi:hypothetical protein